MKREAFKMFLKPGFEKEYEKRHAAIWPELKKMLSDGGVYDYSIYWDKDTNILFACQKTKGEESSQDMGANTAAGSYLLRIRLVSLPDRIL